MEFDKNKVYTAVNADELSPGDKVICANDVGHLKHYVTSNGAVLELQSILDEDNRLRFVAGTGKVLFALAYLVERAQSCKNCIKLYGGKEGDNAVYKDYEPVETKTIKKHYRPFKNTDELIEEWDKKLGYRDPTGLAKPYIWVKYKYDNSKGSLITVFGDDYIYLGDKDADIMTMYDLFNNYIFLDGSPCGVKE